MTRTKEGKVTSEVIEVRSSPIDRHLSDPGPGRCELSKEAWELLPMLKREALRKMGFKLWSEEEDWPHKAVLMLIPGEWFDVIPEGMSLVDINGKLFSFRRKTCSNDTRFGYLAYGVFAFGDM